MSNKSKIDVTLTMEELKALCGDQFLKILQVATKNVYCRTCAGGYNQEMTDYEVRVNHLGDLLFDGLCATCGSKVGRYVETGEQQEFHKKAMELRRQKLK